MIAVLVAAQETGSANALVPVMRELQRRADVRVTLAVCGDAVDVMERARVPHRVVRSPEEAGALLAEASPDVLVLGTALGPSLEKTLLRLTQDDVVPSLSIIDRWLHERERFLDADTGALRLPTVMAVMDEAALERAVQAGLPRERLVVTGQPHLEHLALALQEGRWHREAQVLRKDWLAGAHEGDAQRVMLFASEMLSGDVGYTQAEALEGVVEALELFESAQRTRATVVVKLHPQEGSRTVRVGPRAARRVRQVVHQAPAWSCVLAADAVIGMTSMLLVEAVVAGRPAMSFQPMAQQWMPLPVAATPEQLAQQFRTMERLREDGARFVTPGAAARVADLALGLPVGHRA